MIVKAAAGSAIASLSVLLLPLAAAAASVLFVVIAAVCWMSVVHGMLARLDGRGVEEARFPVAERSGADAASGRAGIGPRA